MNLAILLVDNSSGKKLYRTSLQTSSKRGMDGRGTKMNVGVFLQQGVGVG